MHSCNLPPATCYPTIFEGSACGVRSYVRMHITMGDIEQLLLQGQYEEAQLARALLDRYYTPLYYLAYSILDDTAAADDIVQETLLTALNKIEQYELGTNLKAWLYRIAVNRSRDVLRRRKVRQKWQQTWSRISMTGSPMRAPERDAADHELAGELWQAVDQLHDKHRLPLILFYGHGMTAPEIAQILGIREGTV